MVTPDELRALAARTRLERDIEKKLVEAAECGHYSLTVSLVDWGRGADERYPDAIVERLIARYAAFNPALEHWQVVLSWDLP